MYRTDSVSCQNEEIYGIVLHLIFLYHFTLFLKKKLQQHVGHKWVTSRLLCGSVGQVGQQVTDVIHFQTSWMYVTIAIVATLLVTLQVSLLVYS